VDCHQDYHLGRFAQRERKGACEECHTVDGFIPTRYTIALHNSSKYPLQGSHLAIPCNLCHIKTVDGTKATTRFTFESTRCAACHKDAHKGELTKYIKEGGCESCHLPEAWNKVQYDHNRTKFPLTGAHIKAACGACHVVIEKGQKNERKQFINLTSECVDCHKDIHRGQFAAMTKTEGIENKTTNCGKCHTPDKWQALIFNHNRDASFKLEGAHLKIGCRDCHKKVGPKDQEFVLYKPLNSSCKSCHGVQKLEPGG
jgi:hypothetical protein